MCAQFYHRCIEYREPKFSQNDGQVSRIFPLESQFVEFDRFEVHKFAGPASLPRFDHGLHKEWFVGFPCACVQVRRMPVRNCGSRLPNGSSNK